MERCVACIRIRGFYLALMRVPSGYPGAVSVGNRVLEANLAARRKGVEDGMLLTSAYSFAPELVVREYERCSESRVGILPTLSLGKGEGGKYAPEVKGEGSVSAHEWKGERGYARQWLDTCARVSGSVEPTSPHCAFVDISHSAKPAQELDALLQEIFETFSGEVTPLAGLSTNKLLAFLACRRAVREWEHLALNSSETHPPFFSFLLPKRRQPEFLRRLPVGELPLDRRLIDRIVRSGMYTLSDLFPVSEEEMVRKFGPEGRRLYQWVRGHDSEPVRALYPPRMVLLRSPEVEIDNEQVALRLLDKLAEAAAARLKEEHGWARFVNLDTRTDGGVLSLASDLSAPIRDTTSLRSVLRRLFRKVVPGSSIRQFTIRMEVDHTPAALQPDLFSDPMEEARRTLLEKALRWARRRFGSTAVLRDLPSSRRERLRAFYELPGA